MEYDEFMDKECVVLCDALNELPGLNTIESCCGHCRSPYLIFFRSDNIYSLAIVARSFDRRYSGTHKVWEITIETDDSDNYPQYCYCISSDSTFSTEEEMLEDVQQLVKNIKHWSQERFKEYFKYGK